MPTPPPTANPIGTTAVRAPVAPTACIVENIDPAATFPIPDCIPAAVDPATTPNEENPTAVVTP